MNYIKDMFNRMNLYQIQQFLMDGTEHFGKEKRPYSERIKVESDPIYARLKSLYPDGTELDKAVAELSQAITTCETVYMEIGMKAGARLICQLLLKDDLPTEKE